LDDNNSSVVSNLSQILNTGVPQTFYIVSSWSNAGSFQSAKNAGCEIGNHTATHPQTGSASDIDTCSSYIQSTYGTKPLTFAIPYGNTASYSSYMSSRFLLARGVNGGTISATSGDPYNLNCNIPSQGASASTMANYFSQARSAGGWCILLVHGFTGDSSAYQPVDVSQYISCINTVKGYGNMWLDTLLNVGAYWRAQQMSITSSQSGSDIIYRWTLPANFPSGKYLRITLTGGTPKQNGQVINWDSHGYYEIALDAGSLTVSSNSTSTPTESVSPSPTESMSPSPTVTPSPTSSAIGGCSVSYSMNDWGSGATVSITIKNNGTSAINGWTLGFSFPGNQKITNLWNGSYTQSGNAVTITNATYNSTIPAGGSVTFGFNISYSGTNAKPTSSTLNGTSYTVQ
jgi:hypothetical protein